MIRLLTLLASIAILGICAVGVGLNAYSGNDSARDWAAVAALLAAIHVWRHARP